MAKVSGFHVRELCRKIAALPHNVSDPFTYSRTLAHFYSGSLSLDDLKDMAGKGKSA